MTTEKIIWSDGTRVVVNSSRLFFARIWIAPILNQSAKGATVCEGRLEIGGTEDEQTSDHTRNNI